jgi:saccharopine dehydrogenase (NADP+, L-glutamate forming)
MVKPLTIQNGEGKTETFEVYPNRDSIPYREEYQLENIPNLKTFVRGTIRLQGWKTAWSSIFSMIPTATHEQIETKAAELWRENAYGPNDPDRVVLYVSLEARQNGKTTYQQSYLIDECGTGRDTAMAKLVSWPATFAVESIIRGERSVGVQGAPHDEPTMKMWLSELKKNGVKILLQDSHLTSLEL